MLFLKLRHLEVAYVRIARASQAPRPRGTDVAEGIRHM